MMFIIFYMFRYLYVKLHMHSCIEDKFHFNSMKILENSCAKLS